MKKTESDIDAMLPEYDFSHAKRGTFAGRLGPAPFVVEIDPTVRDIFPTADSINEALRGLATIVRARKAS